jgi:hypothetical protein
MFYKPTFISLFLANFMEHTPSRSGNRHLESQTNFLLLPFEPEGSQEFSSVGSSVKFRNMLAGGPQIFG